MENERKRPDYRDCDGFLIPGPFSEEAFRSAVNYKPKSGELFTVSYPKCGSTWMKQIIILIFGRGQLSDKLSEINYPFLDLTGTDAMDYISGDGAIKTHLPFNLAQYSPSAKYIYIARNPRDLCVSFYHHTKDGRFYNFSDGIFDEYFKLFINGKTDYGDYFDHLLSWYEHKDEPNILFTTYENLKLNGINEILKIAKFIGDEHYNAIIDNTNVLENILKFSSFEYMKNTKTDLMKNASENLFNMYRGMNLIPPWKNIGDWKNHFSPEQEKRMEERIKEKTANSDVMSLWKNI
ncbi:sulfotransferase ssu-1-like [Centruroides vittatus]|uniref:sulfotransferase ssu-1-like n=1 Tax=Centruroides vittatus TaxID=120091 RepID=UPI0035104F2D